MKTIYAVSEGSYSDYHIVALFSTEEKAKAFMAAFPSENTDFNGIEQFQLDTDVPDLMARGYRIYCVHMLINGDVEKVWAPELSTHSVGQAGQHCIWPRSTAPAYAGKGVQDCLISTVWAKSDKAAIKIANEKRAQMIANGEWK